MSRSSRRLRRWRTVPWHVIYLAVIISLAVAAFLPGRRPRVISLRAPQQVSLVPAYGSKIVVLAAGRMTIGDFAEKISSQTGVRVVATWPTIPKNEYDPDRSHILIPEGGRISLEEALRMIPARSDGDLRVAYEQDRVVIGLEGVIHAPGRCKTVVYPVGDFLVVDSPEPAESAAEARMRALTNLFEGTVTPENWRENGGEFGDIRSVADTLVVTNTPDAQYKVAALLAALRAAR